MTVYQHRFCGTVPLGVHSAIKSHSAIPQSSQFNDGSTQIAVAGTLTAPVASSTEVDVAVKAHMSPSTFRQHFRAVAKIDFLLVMKR